MYICEKEECPSRKICHHSKEHMPFDGAEMICILSGPERGCPTCTWIGEGDNHTTMKKLIRKNQQIHLGRTK